MTELERKLKAKIPGTDTGIQIKKTMCDICTPLCHCGIDAYVKNGTLLKVEGTKGHPMNDGALCTKGANNRAYIYRNDRLTQPLKRTGERGSNEFTPISWNEAYDIIAEKLLATKAQYGPNSVAFYSGYDKWYRFMLQRFAFAFGSINYGSESSACFTANRMGWMTMTGKFARPDLENAQLHVAWSSATHYSRFNVANNLRNFKQRGGKLIIVDPRLTPAAIRDADLHLRIKPGTDGLLANCIAGLIIRNKMHDENYINQYVHGFDAYRDYVCSLDIDEVSKITTVPRSNIEQAAQMIGSIKPMAIENSPGSVIHQTNGYQSARAIFALSVITGNYDRPGGNQPLDFTYCEQSAGFHTLDEEFAMELVPKNFEERIGAKRFPVWGKLINQMQSMDLARQIITSDPYPVRALFACGMNHRMFPQSSYMEQALKELDFYVDIDLFMTDSAKMADIILPACSSFEREEFKVYPGGYAAYYERAINPVGESRSDAQIIQDLCPRLGIKDEYLLGGYRKCIEYCLNGTGLSIDEMLLSELPVKVPNAQLLHSGSYITSHCNTPSGKLELYSEVIASCNRTDLDPLPRYTPTVPGINNDYPMILLTGVRVPNMIHTRLHKVPWARSLRKTPMADISLEDATAMGLEYGDDIIIRSPYGAIYVQANPTEIVSPGQIYMFHGYSEADANSLLSHEHLDPYSGFPGFKSGICRIERRMS